MDMERRQHERVEKHLKMACVHPETGAHAIRTEDVSLGGMRLTSSGQWKVGDKIVIHFRFGGKAKAKIVRIVETRPGWQVFGLQFTKIDKKTAKKIKKIIKKKNKKT